MATSRLSWYWLLVTVILVVIIAIGGVFIWLRYNPSRPVEIALSPSLKFEGEIYLGGAVANPGVYPLSAGDTVEALLRAAGGTIASANLSGLKLYIPPTGAHGPQKIDINRAEVWLLKALPGIGDILAQRIVGYREEHGFFRTTSELLKIPGFGPATYERIRDKITVAE